MFVFIAEFHSFECYSGATQSMVDPMLAELSVAASVNYPRIVAGIAKIFTTKTTRLSTMLTASTKTLSTASTPSLNTLLITTSLDYFYGSGSTGMLSCFS